MMHRAKKTLIKDLNQHLTCSLCNGYFIDATTIIECLHTFCRSCIVKYLQSNKYCPVCDVQVHKTKPLLNIRPDKTLQDIVYKLVPRLLQNELQRRRQFYSDRPEAPFDLAADHTHIITSDESISLTLSYSGCTDGKSARYLRCPAAVTCGHLQKLIRAKYGLLDHHHVDIFYNNNQDCCLHSHLTLMDIAYIYSWKRKAPIELTFRIYQSAAADQVRVVKSEKSEVVCNNNNNNNNNTWKEVQLRISENGEMSITGIQEEDEEEKENSGDKVGKDSDGEKKEEKVDAGVVNNNCKEEKVDEEMTKKGETTKSSSVEEVPKEIEQQKGTKRKAEPVVINEVKKVKKQQLKGEKLFQKPQNVNLNKTLIPPPPLPSINHYQQRPGTPIAKPVSKPCYMPSNAAPKPAPITVPKPGCSKKTQEAAKNLLPPPPAMTTTTASTTCSSSNKVIRSKASTPIGYKTLRDPPKSWNSQISKAKLHQQPCSSSSSSSSAGKSDEKNVRPAKFFKMRNNIPRYLGNPASGVKPMYQVHVSPEKDKTGGGGGGVVATVVEPSPPPPPSQPKGEIKKHSIVKIDPKTLKPISEKAPETTSLSNSNATSADLKINTSSVSIFNPLKLQNCERKSPKSPHSPKMAKSSSSSSSLGGCSSGNSKLNLNFTPANPFIPNLASPTMSPGQFLYPAGGPPSGFPPPYDPRVMAAYHSFFYGQRMAFPAGLSLDLNATRKNFEMAAAVAAAAAAAAPTSPQQHSPSQASGLKIDAKHNSTKLAMASPSSAATSKKLAKESSKSNEKSLQNAVEKLTQNRVKEIRNSEVAAAAAAIAGKQEKMSVNNNAVKKSGVVVESERNKSSGSGEISSNNNSNEISNKDNQNVKDVGDVRKSGGVEEMAMAMEKKKEEQEEIKENNTKSLNCEKVEKDGADKKKVSISCSNSSVKDEKEKDEKETNKSINKECEVGEGEKVLKEQPAEKQITKKNEEKESEFAEEKVKEKEENKVV